MINPEIKRLYLSLHKLGLPIPRGLGRHRTDWRAVWGSSWLSLFGEIMFSRRSNASKLALAHLMARLHYAGFFFFDAQFRNDHLLQFGLIEIPKQQFQRMLHTALKTHLDWPFIASEK